MVDLTKTSIDFEDLVAELEADLRTRDSFQALFPGETSKVFTEHGAGITALMLYHIHSASQNAFFPTAFSKQAVYALAASLGRPPRRKLGAQLEVQLTVNTALAGSITLPQYSRFSARGLEWYTIEDYVIPAGVAGQVLTTPLVLRQGERITDSFTASGNANQRIEIGEEFKVDENYLEVSVDGTPYIKNGSSLLNAAAGDLVYAEQTASNGRVLILFGNNVIGSIPTLSTTIEISYSNTAGANSNSSITADPFQYLEVFDIGGGTLLELNAISTTSSSGGSEEETIDQVKNVAPKVYAANQRAVRRDDYLGFLLSETGATAGAVWGEYEEATQKGFADLTMMNRVYVSAVPNDLQAEEEVIEVGLANIYSGTTSFTDILPGSVSITSDLRVPLRPHAWEDLDGKGILLSDEISIDSIDGTGATAASDTSFTHGNAFDRDPGFDSSAWQSDITPTATTPVRVSYDFGVGNEEPIRSIRISAGIDSDPADRAFPKKIILLASNLTSPDITDRNDWEVIRGGTLLEDPGFAGSSKWIPVDDKDNSTAYRHFAIEVLDVHGGADKVRIANVELQEAGVTSTIDYTTGDYYMFHGTNPDNNPVLGEDITLTALSNNYNASYKEGLIEYLNEFNHFTTLIEYRDSVAVPINILADVYFLEGFDSGTILSNVQTAINDLFTINKNSIGTSLYLSDIYQAIQDVEGVDYTILQTPTLDTIVEIDQFVNLSSQTLNILPTDR